MSGKVPIVVIGAGRAGLRHARAAADCPEVSLAAVVDPSEEGRARAAERDLPTAADIAEAPAGVRAAVIAVPPSARAAQAEAAAERGWALLVDRPLAHTLRDARRIVAAAEAAGVPLLVAHHRRHHPCVAAAREAVTGGLLGRLVAADAVWLQRRPQDERRFAWRVSSGEGPGLAALIDDLDLLRWLAGDIVQVAALGSRADRSAAADDTLAVALRFGNGALATAIAAETALSPWAWEAGAGGGEDIARSGQDCLRLTGTEGALSLPSLAYWRQSGDGPADWSSALTRLPLPWPDTDPFVAQLSHLARVAEGAEAPLVSGEDGLRSLAAAFAVEESARVGRPVVPDPERPDAWEPTATAIFRDLSDRRGAG